MSGETRQRLHVYLSPTTREQIRKVSEHFDLSMAAYLRRAVTMQIRRDQDQEGLSILPEEDQDQKQDQEAPEWLRPPSSS